MGPSGVGKSSTVRQLLYGDLDEDGPTIWYDYTEHTIKVDGKYAKLRIRDLPGSCEFSYRNTYEYIIKNNDGILLMYSITDCWTVEMVEKVLYEKILEIKKDDGDAFYLVLVANKYDLFEQRQVPHDEGLQLAKEWNVPFIEQSAKTGENVKHAFETLVRGMRGEVESVEEELIDNGWSLNSCQVM